MATFSQRSQARAGDMELERRAPAGAVRLYRATASSRFVLGATTTTRLPVPGRA